jgi:hypothetical protein
MTRLKSRTKHPPGAFQILFPELGMEKPFSGSFDACKTFVRGIFQKNPFYVKKNGWSLDDNFIDNLVEAQNVARLIAHGWTTFLVVDGADAPAVQAAKAQKKTQNQVVAVGRAASGNSFVGHVRKAAAGIGLVRDWLGEGLEPVAQEVADKRAAICVACPKNQAGDFFQRVEASIGEGVRTLIGVATDLNLRTPLDAKLETCVVCDCYIPLKVWPPLKHILENTSPEVMADLDERCWIKVSE